jgi:hypothetical protein
MPLFRLTALLLGALLLLPAPSPAQRPASPPAAGQLPAAARSAAERITAAQLSDYLHFIASDEMEGRDTPSRGLDLTAKFLATLLSRWGLKPAGDDGTFFQKIALKRERVDPEGTTAALGDRALRLGEDFVAQRGRGGAAGGNLIYVGHGWVVPAKNINAYRGVNVRGKILVVAGSRRPRGVTTADLRGKRGEDWFDADAYAAKNGAAGIVRLPPSAQAEAWDRLRSAAQRSGGGWSVERLEPPGPGGRPGVATITISPPIAETLLKGERLTLAQALAPTPETTAFNLAEGKTLTFAVRTATERRSTQNVVAVLEGSDPVLRREYVALGAHYDHVGIGTPIEGDGIYNGADDDGSGTVALLAMAEAASRGPRPRRSLLFVWHAGEEHGLWGSRYFTEFPTVPLKQIVAQLNMDMIGRSKRDGDTDPRNAELSGPNEIYVIGSRMLSAPSGISASGSTGPTTTCASITATMTRTTRTGSTTAAITTVTRRRASRSSSTSTASTRTTTVPATRPTR